MFSLPVSEGVVMSGRGVEIFVDLGVIVEGGDSFSGGLTFIEFFNLLVDWTVVLGVQSLVGESLEDCLYTATASLAFR